MSEGIFSTKADRHKIYKKAKEYYKCQLVSDWPIQPGICACIDAVIGHQNCPVDLPVGLGDHSKYFNKTNLPELFALKPVGKSTGQFWWQPGDKEIRIKVFNTIIEQTKKDKKNGKNKA